MSVVALQPRGWGRISEVVSCRNKYYTCLDLELEEQGLDPMKQIQYYLLHRLFSSIKGKNVKVFHKLEEKLVLLGRRPGSEPQTAPRPRQSCWNQVIQAHELYAPLGGACAPETTCWVCKDLDLLHIFSFALGSFLSRPV